MHGSLCRLNIFGSATKAYRARSPILPRILHNAQMAHDGIMDAFIEVAISAMRAYIPYCFYYFLTAY